MNRKQYMKQYMKEYGKNYRKRNKELLRKTAKKYRENNKEAIKIYSREHYKNNKRGSMKCAITVFMIVLVVIGITSILVGCEREFIEEALVIRTTPYHGCDWHIDDNGYGVIVTERGYYCGWCEEYITPHEYHEAKRYAIELTKED